MLEEIKRDLESHYDWNFIYYNLDSAEYEKVKELLKDDYGFLDIVLDFDDYEKLDKLKSNIPESLDKDMITSRIVEQYVNYKILKQAYVDGYDLSKSGKDLFSDDFFNLDKLETELFSGDFESYKNSDWLFFNDLEQLIKKEVQKKENGYGRIFVLFDSVNDVDLQKKINDLIVFRTNIAIMGYTTKEDLISYRDTNGVFVEDPHDYISKIKKIERRY